MKDKQIMQLYWDRHPEAITATAEKYGKYCTAIAKNILNNVQDSEECVNDTYLKTWNVIPPQRPTALSAFLGKITRNLALDRYRRENATKRGGKSGGEEHNCMEGGNVRCSFEELQECIASRGVGEMGSMGACGKENVQASSAVEEAIMQRELTGAINQFLASLPQKKRILFVCRYWYFDSVSDIAKRVGMTENSVSVNLKRIRDNLRIFLIERGYEV